MRGQLEREIAPVQSISSSAYDGAQPSTDEDDDNETDSRGPHSNENGQQNGIPSAASAQKAFNVDALAKRGKSKQPTAKKEVSTPKPPTGKKGKKVRARQAFHRLQSRCFLSV